MSEEKPTKTITGYECRFVVFCPPSNGEHDDLHVVKEVVHFSDGTTMPQLRPYKNFKRPFYITRKGLQNHKDKKEWEKKENLVEYQTTQSDLYYNVAKALEKPWIRDDRELKRSPFLYGSDILSTAVLKRKYMDTWPGIITPYSVAVYDVETNVFNEEGDIIMGTLSFKNNVVTAVRKSFFKGHADVENRLHAAFHKYLGNIPSTDDKGNPISVNVIAERGIKWTLVMVDDECDVVTTIFDYAHKWKPDFIAIWNIDFDIPKSVNALTKRNIDPKDVFCDPSVPYKFRRFKYRKGPTQKKTATGKMSPIPVHAQWHIVECPASFYFIDPMCAYKHNRIGEQEEQSYKLDAILDKHLKMRKLHFDESGTRVGIDLHMFMQEKYPFEYVIYNVFDCISVEMLDEKIKDLQLTLPMNSGCSDFYNFRSQPRRRADDLHFFLQGHNHIIGSTSDEMADELDDETIDGTGWIVTLPAHLIADNGLCVIKEMPNKRTNIRIGVGDLDVAASYPNGGCVLNISKETTHLELVEIKGVPEIVQRQQGINLSGGATNSVEVACALYGLPGLETMLESFRSDLEKKREAVL